MTAHKSPSGYKGKSSRESEKTAGQEADLSEDACRCKEVSKKTVPEMLRLMLDDLAFWKKAKERKGR